MDIPRDEVRRQLRDSQREQRQAMPRFREALARVFDPSSARRRSGAVDASAATKAQLVGAPDRRQVLLIGGTTVLGAAVLAACADQTPPKVQLAQTGTAPGQTSSTTATPDQAYETDLTLLRTAQSIEATAIVAYQLALDSGKLTTKAIADAAKFFEDQHREHKGALVSQTRAAGGQPYANPSAGAPPSGIDPALWAEVNPTLWTEVDTALKGDPNEKAIVKLANTLENLAAQTYNEAAGVLSTALLRSTIMSIGGIEARHVAVLLGVLNANDPKAQAPFAFEGTADAAPPASYVGPGPHGAPPSSPKGTGTSIKATGTTIKPAATGSTKKSG